MRPTPGRRAPELRVSLVAGGEFNLADRRPPAFSLVVFYRGLHCPLCRKHLQELVAHLEELESCGVEALAITTEGRDRAESAWRDWSLGRLAVGYGLPIEQARAWGLYISTAIHTDEPPVFAEPGIFLVRPDLTIHAVYVQSTPIARPSVVELLRGIQYATRNGSPARGTA